MKLVNETKKVKLADLEAGTLFKCNGDYALKSEYRNDSGTCECFILGTGEMFWGATTATKVNNLMVEPINLEWLLKQAETLREIADTWVAIETNGTTEDADNFYTIVQDILTKHEEE